MFTPLRFPAVILAVLAAVVQFSASAVAQAPVEVKPTVGVFSIRSVNELVADLEKSFKDTGNENMYLQMQGMVEGNNFGVDLNKPIGVVARGSDLENAELIGFAGLEVENGETQFLGIIALLKQVLGEPEELPGGVYHFKKPAAGPGPDPFGEAPGEAPKEEPGDFDDLFGTPKDETAPGAAPKEPAAPSDGFDDLFGEDKKEEAAPPEKADDPFGAAPGLLAVQDDPFGAPVADPPATSPAAADPFAPPAEPKPAPSPRADPFAAPPTEKPGADPFGEPADPGDEPFGAPAGDDPFGGPGAGPGGDPFGGMAPTEFFVKEHNGWILFSTSAEGLQGVPANPSTLLGELTSDIAWKVMLEPLSADVIDQLKQGVQDVNDGKEPEFDKQFAEWVDQAESLSFTVNIDGATSELQMGWGFTAKPDTDLAGWFTELSQAKTMVAGIREAQAAVTISTTTPLRAESVKALIDGFEESMAEEEADEENAAQQKKYQQVVQDFFRQLANAEQLDLAAAFVIEKGNSFFVAGGQVENDQALIATYKEIYQAIEADPKVAIERAQVVEHQGFRIVELTCLSQGDTPADDDAKAWFGEKVQLSLARGKNTFYTAIGVNATERLKNVIDDSLTKGKVAVAPFELRIGLGEILKLAEEAAASVEDAPFGEAPVEEDAPLEGFGDDFDEEEAFEEDFADSIRTGMADMYGVFKSLIDQSQGKDHIKLQVATTPRGAELRLVGEAIVLNGIVTAIAFSSEISAGSTKSDPGFEPEFEPGFEPAPGDDPFGGENP